MTIQELSQLFWLKREIEREYERLTQLEEAATATTPQWSGLPAAGLVADKTAIAAQIADARTVIKAKLELAVLEYNRLNRYIASIDDSLIRQIIALRFVDGLSWRQVALHAGGGNTEDSVRKAVKRYLEQEKQKSTVQFTKSMCTGLANELKARLKAEWKSSVKLGYQVYGDSL